MATTLVREGSFTRQQWQVDHSLTFQQRQFARPPQAVTAFFSTKGVLPVTMPWIRRVTTEQFLERGLQAVGFDVARQQRMRALAP